eukprot:jgi/Undpi1/4728/HiC_scaffold_18.g08081.m1
MLQGRRAPGHASDWGMTSCTPPSRTVPCSRTRTTPSNVGLSTPNFVGGVEDNARIHSWPVLGEVTRWSNDLRLKVDSNGDCFGLSWITTVLLWAVQERGRMSGLVRRLQEAGEEGGAFHRLDGDCKSYVADLVSYAEGLERDWRNQPAGVSTAEFGTSLAVGVVRTLGGLSRDGSLIEGVGGADPLWLKLRWGMATAARTLDVFAAPSSMSKEDVEKLRTFVESVAFDVGMAGLLESSAAADTVATDSPGDSVMRPTRSLGCVVGIVVDFITRSGGGRRVKNRELAVLNGGLEHYDALSLAATSFGKAPEKAFSLDKVQTTAAELEASGVPIGRQNLGGFQVATGAAWPP